MKTSTIKKAVLSVALSAALVATVSGATFQQKTAAAESTSYEATSYQSSLKTSSNRELVSISNEKQEYFSQSIETFIGRAVEEDVENIDFIYNVLYSPTNDEYGYVLDFSSCNGNGYVIVSTANNTEKIIEMEFGNSSPYINKDGKYIYDSFDNYFIQSDNDTISQITVSGDAYDAGLGASTLNTDKNKVGIYYPVQYDYSTGCVFKKEIPNFYYSYSTSQSSKTNNCANAAGVIALNYWNVYHGNRLLSLTSSEREGTTYNMNKVSSTYYMDKFYSYMDTNWFLGYGGTLPADCYSGFMKLIDEKGYVARKSTVSSFDDIKNQINNNVPVFIVSQDYYFTYNTYLPSINSTQGNYSFNIDYTRTYGLVNAHTFVGIGYAEYTYYDSLGKASQLHLVKIADGWGGVRYFNFDLSNKMSMAAIKVSRC